MKLKKDSDFFKKLVKVVLNSSVFLDAMRRNFYFIFLSFLSVFFITSSYAGIKSRKSSSKSYIPKYSAIVMDAQTGKILEQEDAHGIRHPASLTKMMTLYLAFEALKSGRLSLNTKMSTSSHAVRQIPSKFGLKVGEQITVYQAIMGLITKSANDVAVVLAEHLGGTEEAFAHMMTQKARALGMKSTVFRNASGVPNPGQVTSAYDMAILSRALYYDFPEQYKYFKNQSYTFKGMVHRNHNHLLGKVEGLDGIKTGFIVASGFNLAASAVRYDAAQRPHRLITIVLGGPNRHWRDRRVTELLETNFHKMGLPSKAGSPIPLVLTKPRDRVLETLEDEGLFIKPAVDVVSSAEEETQQVLNTLIEKTVKDDSLNSKPLSSRSRPQPVRWERPLPSAARKKSPSPAASVTTIQLGAYPSKALAQKEAQRGCKELKGGKINLLTPKKGKKNRIIAQITGVPTAQAYHFCHKLYKKGKACQIIK